MDDMHSGDMGNESTKLEAFYCHEEKFNSGTKGRILHFFKEAKDNAANMAICYYINGWLKD